MAGKITDYPPMTLLKSGDLIDVSDFDGVATYTSKSLDYDDLITSLEGDITFRNIYSNDGTLSGNRIVSMGVNDLTFGSTGDVNLLRFDSTSDRIGIGTAAPTEKLEVVGNAFVNSGKLTVLNAFNTSTGTIEATAQATSGSSGFTSAGKFNSLITTAGFSANNVGVLATAVGGTSETFAAKFQVNSGAVDTPTYGTYGVFSRNNATTTTPNYAGYFKSENVNGSSNHAIYGFASGSGTKNIGGLFNATGATNNYAIIVPSGGGNVGIGTAAPTEKLEVVGSIKMVDGNEALGKVITSDANGVGSWSNVVGGIFEASNNGSVVPTTYAFNVTNNLSIRNATLVPIVTFATATGVLIGGSGTNPHNLTLDTSGNTGLLMKRDSVDMLKVTYNSRNPTLRMYNQSSVQVVNINAELFVGHTYFNTPGNFGIGTTTPTDKLQVVGTVDATRYKVNGVAGANFSGAVTNITVVDGIVTAVS